MENESSIDIEAIFDEGTAIDEAMNEAVREAIRLHRIAGQPLAVWRNGRVELISPESVNDGGSKH